jgi:hypothetical protein
VVFGIGYGVGLGLFFGLASGIATGITIAIELNRAARGLDHYPLPWEAFFAAIRGIAFGAGLYRIGGFGFAFAFAVIVTIGQVFAYSRGMRPAIDYTTSRRPRFTKTPVLGHRPPHLRLHRYRADLQFAHSSRRPRLVFRITRRPDHWHRHRRRNNCQSLHRILRGQSS